MRLTILLVLVATRLAAQGCILGGHVPQPATCVASEYVGFLIRMADAERRASESFADTGDVWPRAFASIKGRMDVISVDEAFKVNTINGAYASREESLKGSITEGKLADFVILADDPHTVSKDKIKDIAIVRTVVGGSTAYQA